MENAFNYMLKDNKIKGKMLVYFVIVLCSALCSNIAQHLMNIKSSSVLAGILSLAGVILSFITTGYSISCIRAIKEQGENIVLPFLNVCSNMFTGFKFSISMLLLLVVTVVPILILFIGLIGKISQIILSLISTFLFLLFAIFVLCTAIAFLYLFAKTDSWTTFFKFKEVMNLIVESKWTYWKNVLIMIGIIIVSVIINAIFYFGESLAGVTATSIISSIIGSYLVFVFSYLVATCAKEAN